MLGEGRKGSGIIRTEDVKNYRALVHDGSCAIRHFGWLALGVSLYWTTLGSDRLLFLNFCELVVWILCMVV